MVCVNIYIYEYVCIHDFAHARKHEHQHVTCTTLSIFPDNIHLNEVQYGCLWDLNRHG